MSLTNEDYNEILNEYNARQMENDALVFGRRREINEKIPAYKELEEKYKVRKVS